MGTSPIDKLRASLGLQEVVRVGRSIRRAEALDGFVVGLGKRWVLLHVLDEVVLDGYAAVRVADVTKVKVRGHTAFTLQALAHNSQVVRPLSSVGLDTVADAIAGLQEEFPLVTVHVEEDYPDECFIGRVAGFTKRSVRLAEIDPDAVWDREPTRWSLRDITRLEAGGRYESTLAALAVGPSE